MDEPEPGALDGMTFPLHIVLAMGHLQEGGARTHPLGLSCVKATAASVSMATWQPGLCWAPGRIIDPWECCIGGCEAVWKPVGRELLRWGATAGGGEMWEQNKTWSYGPP